MFSHFSLRSFSFFRPVLTLHIWRVGRLPNLCSSWNKYRNFVWSWIMMNPWRKEGEAIINVRSTDTFPEFQMFLGIFSRNVGCQPKLDGEFQIIIDLSDIHHGFTLFYDEMMMGLSWFMIISNHIMYSFSIYSGFYHVLESSLIFQCVFLIHHGLICQDGSWTFWTVWTSGTLNFYPIDLEKFGSVLVTVTVDQE